MTAAATAPTRPAPVLDAPPLPRPAARPGHGRTARRVARALLTVLAAGLLVRFAVHGWPEIRGSLSHLSARQAPFLGLAVAAEVLWLLAMSQVYRSALLAFGGSLGRATALRVSMAAFTLSRVLPGGGAAGGAVAARELVALGNAPLPTVTSMLVSWWIMMTALSALVCTGVAASVVAGSLPPASVAVPAAVLASFGALGAAVALSAHDPTARARLSGLTVRAVARLGPAMATGAATPWPAGRIRPRGLLAVVAWSAAVWVLDAAALWLALAAFGWRTDIGVLLVGYGVANLIAALPELTPGWLGVIETSVAATLAAFGVPAGIAVLGVLAYRLVSYWLPTAAGVPAAIGVVGHRSSGELAP